MLGRDLDDDEDRLRRSRSGGPDEEFDDGPRRPRPDDNDDFDDFDDRPARRRNWDDDDDERPRRRPASRSSPIPIAVGAVVGLMAAVVGYFGPNSPKLKPISNTLTLP
jgi:hypothetical protein